MANCVSCPSLPEKATYPFRVADMKSYGAAFLQRMSALLLEEEGGGLDLDASALRPLSLEEELQAAQPHEDLSAQRAEQQGPDAAVPSQPVNAERMHPCVAVATPSATRSCERRISVSRGAASAHGGCAGAGFTKLASAPAAAGAHATLARSPLATSPGLDDYGFSAFTEGAAASFANGALEGEAVEAASDTADGAAAGRSHAGEGWRLHPVPGPLNNRECGAALRKASRQRKRPAHLSAYADLAAPAQPTSPAAGINSTQTRQLSDEDALQRGKLSVNAAQPGPPRYRAPLVSAAVKEERVALLEAYQEVVDGVKRRRQEQLEDAGKALHSVHCMLQRQKGPATGTVLAQQQERLAREVEERLARAREAGQRTPVQQMVPPGEVLLHVCVHLPQHVAAAPGAGLGGGGAAHSAPSQELMVLGSQPLTALRDAIMCLTDKNVMAMEEQENTWRLQEGLPPLRLTRPSAYLYVEGTFYNDMRHPEAADCSRPIREFNREHGVAAPPHPHPAAARSDVLTTQFSTARMEGTTFDQLWLRLGSGGVNLYCHQGGCEHAVVFKDVRLFDPGCDPPLLSQYPFRLRSEMEGHKRQCEVCSAAQAEKVTYEDPHTPHTPFFWCNKCFSLMHCEADDRLFDRSCQVFPYTCEYRDSRASVQRPAPTRGVAPSALQPI